MTLYGRVRYINIPEYIHCRERIYPDSLPLKQHKTVEVENMTQYTIDTIIFDLGGVVVNHKNPAEVMGRYGLDSGTFYKSMWRKYKTGKCTEDEFWSQMVKGTQQEQNKDRIKQEVREIFSKAAPEGAYHFLFRLSLNYRVAILSNHSTEWGRSAVESLGLEKYCDPIIISAEVGLAKPDPAIYEYTLKAVNRMEYPDTCLFIDDKQENVDAAIKQGMYATRFTDAEKLQRVLQGFELI